MSASGRTSLAELFSIDTRTLALFRIVLGTLLLFDLTLRGLHLDALYTDAGLLPTATRGIYGTSFSIHWWSGNLSFQAALLAAQLGAAMALLLGYRTRLATIVCWALLTSLHFRGPNFNDGGDAIARMMLLWSIFLPLGARFSLDAKRSEAVPPASVLSAASVAILVQFVLFYTVAGISKSGPAWLDGTAVAAAIDNSYWSRPFGEALLGFPALLTFLTFAARAFETFGPLLFFVPLFNPQFRVATILAFGSFQLGLALSLQLNLFPLFASSATLVFIPAWLWDRLLPETRIEGALERVRGLRRRIGIDLAALLLVAGCTIALGTIGALTSPNWLKQSARYVGFEQAWTMYAPHPPIFDLHFRVLGFTDTKKVVTLLDSSVGADSPDHSEGWKEVQNFHTGYRLKVHLETLLFSNREFDPARQSYLDWVCRSWRAVQPENPIRNVALVALSRRTLSNRDDVLEQRMLAERVCD